MHICGSGKIGCVQNENSRKLIVFIENKNFEANFCPFCGYQPERSKREDSVLNNIPEWGSSSSLNFEEWQRRCGALNSMET